MQKGGISHAFISSRRRLALVLVAVALMFAVVACSAMGNPEPPAPPPVTALTVTEGQHYLKAEDVALYLYQFGSLPENFLTKATAERLGWVASQGNLWVVAPGSAIGGDRFGNREGLLPVRQGRQYYECDVNYARRLPWGRASSVLKRWA
jgi:hypothetical protein